MVFIFMATKTSRITIKTGNEYSEHWRKPLAVETENMRGSQIRSLPVSKIESGGIKTAWKFSQNGSIKMYDSDGNLAIFIGFTE